MPFWKSKAAALKDAFEAAQATYAAGNVAGAQRAFEQVVASARDAGDRAMEAAALQRCGVMRDMSGDSHGAERDVRAALAINLALEGKNGPIVRQDHYTLGIILASRGDHAGAEAPFLESARIAGLNDQDAHMRAIANVVQGRLARDDEPGAFALLWQHRPGGDGPRWLVGSLLAPQLVEMLARRDRLDELPQLAVECTAAQGYWFAKMKMGRISEEAMTAILQAIIDTELAIVRALLKANQRSGAIDAFDRLERHVGNGPLLSEVKQLRARLLEGA